MKNTKSKMLSNAEIASFCRQTSLIIQAGITPAEGMEILIHDTISEDGKALLEHISEDCRRGYRFKDALENTDVFPAYVIRLIALGEEAGSLDSVLNSLADYYDREEEMAESIKSAVTYPLIMIIMMFIIIAVLITKVLPIFKQVFAQLGTEMSPMAEKLMSAGNALSKYAVATTAILVLLIILGIILYKIPKTNKKILRFLSNFPLTRDFYSNMAAGRFASGMYLAFHTGMDTFQSLDMVSELVENEKMQKKIEDLREMLKNRSTMPEAISKAEIFSNLYSRMISVGFLSGAADTVMLRIAEHYERATDRQLRRMLSIIEPTLVIILSLIVGIILLSVLLPLMGIMTSIG